MSATMVTGKILHFKGDSAVPLPQAGGVRGGASFPPCLPFFHRQNKNEMSQKVTNGPVYNKLRQLGSLVYGYVGLCEQHPFTRGIK